MLYAFKSNTILLAQVLYITLPFKYILLYQVLLFTLPTVLAYD